MEKKGAVLFILAILLVLPTVIAVNDYTTTIIVIGEPNAGLIIDVMDVEQAKKIASFNTTMDSEGKKNLKYDSDLRTLSFDVDLIKDHEIIYEGSFGDYISGEVVTIDLATPPPEEEEVVIEEQEEGTEEETENVGESGALTGFAIGDGTLKAIYYSVGIFVLVGIILFFFVVARKKIKRKTDGSDPIVVKKLSDLKKEQKEAEEKKPEKEVADTSKIGDRDKTILELEKKIKEAQYQLGVIKNEEKIKLAEKKLQEDREELERMRKGQ